MPSLHWIGKDKVVNHHHDVPFKIMEHQYSFPLNPRRGLEEDLPPNPLIRGNQDAENEAPPFKEAGEVTNKIIHGDNLEALKALLPEYEGKVKCIYIDPPYNTGNENWVYNDNVNHPKIKKWLHQVVGKEGEDLSRHDKWLCMMYPRLKLLHKLLREDGVIFISIDDNEQANLKLIMDEIFGGGNFVANVIWQKKQSPQNDAINFSDMHDFLIVYAKRKKHYRDDVWGFNRNLIPKTTEQNLRYKNPDNDPRGNWSSGDCSSNKTKYERPNLFYPVVNPNTKEEIYPSESRVWRFEKETFRKLLEENRIYFGKDGAGFPRLKLFLTDVSDGVVPSTWWSRDFAGDNQEGRRALREIFDNVDNDFSTPKPYQLVERVLQISTNPNTNDVILDSFAGSGTTAHAVLNLNKQDGGNRKFILIEMEDYAETITAERVKRVIQGYGAPQPPKGALKEDLSVPARGTAKAEGENLEVKHKGTGGSFDYYTLGERLFDERGNLNEDVGVERIRQYVYFTETRQYLTPIKPPQPPKGAFEEDVSVPTRGTAVAEGDSPYLMNVHSDTAYYFYYERNQITTLDHDFLATIKTKADCYVIYADNCILSKEFLAKYNIIFKKIPRDISRL